MKLAGTEVRPCLSFSFRVSLFLIKTICSNIFTVGACKFNGAGGGGSSYSTTSISQMVGACGSMVIYTYTPPGGRR